MALDARQALRRNLGGDRLASRGEIEKLVLYAHGQKEIGLDDVRAMSGDVSGASFDDAVDAVLEGKIGDFDTAFTRHCQSGGQPFLVLSSAMRQLQADPGHARPDGLRRPQRRLGRRRAPARRCFSRGASWWRRRWSAGTSRRSAAR